MTAPDEPFFHLVTVIGGAFRVGFYDGVDRARIIDADGWIADELQVAEGTCEAIRAEAHRLLDVAVASGRYPGYYPKAGAADYKRIITRSCKGAKATHHPAWWSSRRHTGHGGGSTGR